MTPGLEWVPTLMGSEPRWTVEPPISAVSQLVQPFVKQPSSNITFLAQGGFNKLYEVECTPPAESLVMRVSLPVYPTLKTASEVATLRLVATRTDVPVPRIIAFDALTGPENPLGFEWILMQRISGVQLGTQWPTMDWEAKISLVNRIADLMATMFAHLRFPQIGSIFENGENSSQGDCLPNVVVGQIVSMAFFWDRRSTYDLPRGPFHSSRAWLESRLLLVSKDCNAILSNEDADEDDVETAETTQELVTRLQRSLPDIFPDTDEGQEHFSLCHDDISQQNILVDNSGHLAALVDWECVAVLPLWKTCQFPSFLVGRDRENLPQREEYAGGTEKSDDQGGDDLYCEHVAEYELTKLRSAFLERMETMQPQWVQTWRDPVAQKKADVDMAIQYCDSELCQRAISIWLDRIDKGEEYLSLRELLTK